LQASTQKQYQNQGGFCISIPTQLKKMVIFSTDRHLKFLQKAKYWVMDGTFQSAPDIFTQLYAIHVEVKGQWFPVVLGRMERQKLRI